VDDDGAWFAPKRYGFGSGPPISWQGWALTIFYVATVVVLSVRLKDHPLQMVAAIALPTVAFLVICARTTRGGWRWRWGKDD
jgi:hypothetical protein